MPSSSSEIRPVAQRASGLAVAALCTSLAGALAFLVAARTLLYVGLVAESTSVVIGFVALGNIRRNPALYGKGMAGSGIIIAGLGLTVTVIFWIQVVSGWAR